MMKRILTLFLLAACLLSCTVPQKEVKLPESLEDLEGHTVAVVGGSSTEILISQYPGVEVIRIGLGELAIAVQSGQAEYGMMQEVQFDANHLEEKGLKKCLTGYQKGVSGLAFRLDDTLHCQLFNRFLEEFKESGEYDRWNHDWIHRADSMSLAMCPAPEEGEEYPVGITLSFPFVFLTDDAVSGMEIDLMNRFCAQNGLCPEYQVVEFPALIPSLTAGKIDVVLSHLQITEERAQQVLFSEPYYEGAACCFCRDPEAPAPKRSLTQTLKASVKANLLDNDHWKILLDGLLVTLEISIFALLLAILLGIIFCYFRMRRSRWISGFMKIFTDTIRGIPVLVILMIMFYVVFAKSKVTGTLIAVCSFGLFYGAGFSELFRSGMLSVDKGQWEAGAALGLHKLQVFRLIVLPQALRQIIPVFKGEVISLVKSTSVVGYVAVIDLTFAGSIIRSRTFDAFFPFILISLIYIVLSRLIGHALDALERSVNKTK